VIWNSACFKWRANFVFHHFHTEPSRLPNFNFPALLKPIPIDEYPNEQKDKKFKRDYPTGGGFRVNQNMTPIFHTEFGWWKDKQGQFSIFLDKNLV